MKAKSLLSIMLFLSISFSALAQNGKLYIDTIDKEGTRCVGTYYYYIMKGFTDTAAVGLSIMAEVSTTETHYFLSVKMNNVTFPKEGVFLIKTSKGEIIELSQLQNKYKTEDIHYVPNHGFFQTGTGLYLVDENILELLHKDGISKIRIQTSSGLIDREYKPKQTEKYKKDFDKMYSLIKKTLSQKKDIYTDF